MLHEFTFKVHSESYEFLKKLAQHDNISVHEKAEKLFFRQIVEERIEHPEYWKKG